MNAPTDRLNTALAGRYRIERPLGAGGMATVYLAADLKHDRKVALKVLKPELAAVLGAERFVVEIKTTASLQHPHILPLFDSGTADGFLYYVMPYIEGETIRDKLNRETQFSVDEAVRIAREVADALDYAHRHGVIHRDIKPENILLHDGRAMVMDFGIALALSAAAGGRMTETGLSLGTPHYMSPEQATAEKDLTPRSDVYSLATVLYEMLTGAPPHVGGSAQQIIMRIITDVPRPVTDLRRTVPPNVAGAVARALEKLPADRFDTARAFADALTSAAFVHSTSTTAAGMVHATPARAPVRRGALLAVGSVAVVATALALWGWLRPAPVPPVSRLDLTLGPVPIVAGGDAAISPDGSMIAYAGREGGGPAAIYVRRLDGDGDFKQLAGTQTGESPSFSPDNRWIMFRRGGDNAFAKVSVNGGGASTVMPASAAFFPHWGTADQFVHSGPPGLFVVSISGGKPIPLVGLTGRRPFLLPDGSGVLGLHGSGVAVFDLRTRTITDLIPAALHPVYAASGHLLYVAEGGGLFAVPFDLKSHKVTGEPRRVLERVAYSVGTRGYDISLNGTLVHHDGKPTGSVSATTLLVSVSFDGGRADTVRLPSGRRVSPRISPDGRSIAYLLSGDVDNVFAVNLTTGTNTQLTFDGRSANVVWSPDGRQIAYSRRDSTAVGVGSGLHLFVKAADNSGAESALGAETLSETPSEWFTEDQIAVTVTNATNGQDVAVRSSKAGGALSPYLNAPWAELGMVVSPDGKFAAFTANETGTRSQIWLRDFPTPTGKWLVSDGAGQAARWSRDGRYIYFWRVGPVVDSLFRVQVDRAPSPVVRTPQLTATIDAAGVVNWDLYPDGKRFLIAIPDVPAQLAAQPGAVDRHVVVLNWFTELRRALDRHTP